MFVTTYYSSRKQTETKPELETELVFCLTFRGQFLRLELFGRMRRYAGEFCDERLAPECARLFLLDCYAKMG
jgi:hypothetical protein